MEQGKDDASGEDFGIEEGEGGGEEEFKQQEGNAPSAVMSDGEEDTATAAAAATVNEQHRQQQHGRDAAAIAVEHGSDDADGEQDFGGEVGEEESKRQQREDSGSVVAAAAYAGFASRASDDERLYPQLGSATAAVNDGGVGTTTATEHEQQHWRDGQLHAHGAAAATGKVDDANDGGYSRGRGPGRSLGDEQPLEKGRARATRGRVGGAMAGAEGEGGPRGMLDGTTKEEAARGGRPRHHQPPPRTAEDRPTGVSAGGASRETDSDPGEDPTDDGADDVVGANVDVSRPGTATNVRGRAMGQYPEWGMRQMRQRAAQSVRRASTRLGRASSSTWERESRIATEVTDAMPVVYADEVTLSTVDEEQKTRWPLWGAILLAVVCCLIVGLAVGLTGRSGGDEPSDLSHAAPSPTYSPTHVPMPTLERVREAGVLRCGVCVGAMETCGGLSVDLCRAVAAAVFGNSSQVEIVPLLFTDSERFIALANGSVDLDAGFVTQTMERHVYHPEAGQGFSFTAPYLYSGLKFGGIPPFASCADKLSTAGECKLLKICVFGDTTHYDTVSELFQASRVVKLSGSNSFSSALLDGTCNAIAGEPDEISHSEVRDEGRGYLGKYEVGSRVFSKEPLAIMTRNDDPVWSDFVNWVLLALKRGEEHNATQSTAIALAATTAFDHENYTSVFTSAIAAVGNYGELYHRHIQDIIPRSGMNALNDENAFSGLLYSHPFGNVLTLGPGPTKGGTMERIIDRGSIRCGIRQLPGFGELDAVGQTWNGLDADYCRAVASGLFEGNADALEFVNVTGSIQGYKMLIEGDIDLLSGGSVNLMNEVREPPFGEGISYSQPYFFPPSTAGKNSTLGEAFALTALDNDAQFSAFVYWIVASTFYAEESGIAKMDPMSTARMPAINLFGPRFVRMFRDPVIAVGNYAELYTRNVEWLFPRDFRFLECTTLCVRQHR